MEKITYKNKKGVFIPDTEFEQLQDKILAQRMLIADLERSLKYE